MMNRKASSKMTDLNPIIAMLGLNLSGLYTPIKRQKLSDQIKMQDLSTRCLQDMTLSVKTHK